MTIHQEEVDVASAHLDLLVEVLDAGGCLVEHRRGIRLQPGRSGSGFRDTNAFRSACSGKQK